jgi:hypothetical protein
MLLEAIKVYRQMEKDAAEKARWLELILIDMAKSEKDASA